MVRDPQQFKAVGAALVDRAEDQAVAVSDALAGAVELAAHGHEIRVVGKGRRERIPIACVPGQLQTADDVACYLLTIPTHTVPRTRSVSEAARRRRGTDRA